MHMESGNWGQVFHIVICSVILAKDIMYVVLYPHINWLTHYLLWMSIIGPYAYVYTRTALGNGKIIMTFLILFGYDW